MIDSTSIDFLRKIEEKNKIWRHQNMDHIYQLVANQSSYFNGSIENVKKILGQGQKKLNLTDEELEKRRMELEDKFAHLVSNRKGNVYYSLCIRLNHW